MPLVKIIKWVGTNPQQIESQHYIDNQFLFFCSYCNFSPDKWSCITESRSIRYIQTWEKVFFWFCPFLSLAIITLRESVRSHSETERLYKVIDSFHHVHRFAYGGTVEETSRRAHMQSLHGQGGQHRLHPLWSLSGLQRVCAFFTQVPHMQRIGQRHSPYFPIIK